jgi:hypothetical protein
MPFGSWPVLVIQGRLEVSPRVPVHWMGRKTPASLGESFSIPLVEMPMLSTSPNMPKSLKPLKSVDKVGGYSTAPCGLNHLDAGRPQR